MMLEEEDDNLQEGDYRISDKDAIRCALSIPEEFVPTPHKDFIQHLVRQDSVFRKDSTMLSNVKKRKPSIQNGDEDEKSGLFLSGIENPLAKETDRKLRSAFAKYKKWDEAERSKVEKLGDNKLLINNSVIIEIDYINYTKEEDVILEMDEDWKTCPMPTLPLPTAPNCQAPPCRLGCICESISQDPIPRTHCGKFKCCLECTCQQTLFPNGDDGDIRSRLRPRVSLLNWRYMESSEGEKDPPLANYRQLERGATLYPRMRRVPVAPQRFRNEYIMSHKFKDTFGRERRTAGNALKFIRKAPVVGGLKRDNRGNAIYRRNYAVKPTGAKATETLPTKISKCKPCTVSIDPINSAEGSKNTDILRENQVDGQLVQPELLVPQLVQVMTEDGQVLLMGTESMCFFAWTLHSKQPRAVIYKSIKGDMMPIPWLYVPIPSYGEAWIFHQVSENLTSSTFIYVPEINCVIPSKALQFHFNTVQAKKKGTALKILWIGKDCRKRMGSIYIFPELPGVLVCGPFPKAQIRSRYGPKSGKLANASKVVTYIQGFSGKRFLGDNDTWDRFFNNKSKQAYTAVKENLLKEDEGSDDDVIPEDVFTRMTPGFSAPVTQNSSVSSSSSLNMVHRKPGENLRVSWKDAARLFSVRPSVL